LFFSKNLKTGIKIAIILAATFYFIFHAIVGQNGLHSYQKIKTQLNYQKMQLPIIEQQVKELQKRTNLLESDSIDLDLLEETGREILNYAFPEDIIIIEK
jgi:cell division protein FtsB